jgi:phage tail sheath protein FI
MPVTVSYPGVYIDEVSSGVHTITSVSTSIAAFFGRTSKGKLNHAERCLSLADFQRKFGAPHAQSYLGHAVRQFFANGGTDCYVVRLASGASAASVTLNSLATPAQPVLVATARSEGGWGNNIRMEVDYATTSAHDTFNLTVKQQEGTANIVTERYLNLSMNPLSPRFAPAFVTQSSDLIELGLAPGMGDPLLPLSPINTLGNSFAGYSQARRPFATAAAAATAVQAMIGLNQDSFTMSVNDGPPVPVTISGPELLTAANIEAVLKTRINTSLSQLTPTPSIIVTLQNGGPNVGVLLTITSDSGALSSIRVNRATSQDAAGPLLLGIDQGGLEQARFSNFRPAPNASLWHMHPGAVVPFDPINLSSYVNALAGLAQNAVTGIAVNGAANALPVNALVTTLPAEFWHQMPGASGDGVREKLDIIVAAINAQAALPFKADRWGYEIALSSKVPSLNAIPTGIALTAIGVNEDLALNTAQYALGPAGSSLFTSLAISGLEGAAPTPPDFFGSELLQTGFHALDSVDLFNLMVIPADDGVSAADHNSLWGPASVYCAAHRAFLLVDAPASWTSTDGRPLVASTTSMISLLNVSSKQYAGVFYPRLIFSDGSLKKRMGPAGAIAGLMARTDATRGVWKAPAGIEADVRDVLGVEVKLTDIENGVLNKKAVNCLRLFPNGLVNWGARTLDGDDDFGSEWKYIPIRRLALNIEESLYRGTKWVVFEPNDEPLWAKIRLNLNAYMMSLFRQGAFQGTSPKDAFFVKCDKDTTTQDDRNKGIVNIEVGFAPLKPAEFVVIKIQQIAGDL